MKFYTLLFCTLLLSACSQRLNELLVWQEYYAAQKTPNARILKAWPTGIIEQMPDGKLLEKEFFYDTKQLIKQMELSSPGIINGQATTWSDAGVKTSEGQYEKNKRIGNWSLFDRKTGKLTETGLCKNGEREGLWKFYNGKTGKLEQEVFYKNGKFEGKNVIFDENGTVKKTQTYKDGNLVLVEGEKQVVDIKPEFPCDSLLKLNGEECSEKSLGKFLAKNIRYPKRMREIGVSGRAIVGFTIEKNGSISNIEIVKGVSYDLQNEVLRVINLMPPWSPGTQNDVPVRVNFTLPVLFKLE